MVSFSISAVQLYFGIALFGCALAGLVALIAGLAFTHARYRRDIRYLSDVDPITGGGSASWFFREARRRIDQEPEGSQAMLILDINNFRLINDAYGREAGNRVLRYVLRVISSYIEGDELAARLTGDNFGILLRCSDPGVLEERVSDIGILLNDFNFERETKYFMLVSVGLYIVNDKTMDITRIKDCAHMACRNAKEQSGGGLVRYRFFRELDRKLMVREKDLENKIEGALANHHLLVYLQPKVELDSGTVAGAEALVRWNDPEWGMIPPSDFIYLFERNGFIVALDLYVFREVCRTLRGWLDQGITPVPVSVNLSRVHLSNDFFLNQFEEVRREYDIPAELLEFELTESMAFENIELLRRVFAQIRELGYCSSLDDFGSGYSSLNILRNISVDYIKLDRAFFVGDADAVARGESIIESVVQMARRLGIRTVSEGIESPEQVEFLRRCDCDMIQGYVFSQPLPIDQFESLAYGERVAGRA